MAELALREKEMSAAREHISMVKQAGANLLSIINDVLDLSKIEAESLKIIPRNYRFSSLLNDVISIIRMRIIDSQLLFVVNVDSTVADELIGDEPRIRQILVNLLTNAVKYTDRGYVSLGISYEPAENDAIKLVIKVKDSGRGVKEEDIGKLFDEYMRVDTETNIGIEGIGLGLTITKRLVKVMGGDIGVESEYGKGSVFTVTLPQRVYNPQRIATVENASEKRTLVYESRGVYAESIAYSVENLGGSCVMVSDDDELKQALNTGSFSYLFTSRGLHERHKDMLEQYKTEIKIVLLTEFGDPVPDKKLITLAMPAHSVSIANILNGGSEKYSYSDAGESIARFIAPDARVLLVDDINTNLIVAKGLLQPYKMEVDLRLSGIEAIKAVQVNKYDIIFMDHKMPGMDGMEAMERIRALKSEDGGSFESIPIIALTANAVSGMREMFLENGFNDYLSKPIDTGKLNEVLESWIPKEKQLNPAIENGN
jgi:CheY-like chemotaxis protein/anti-sigma regulatory factor (Ser/Thr protein kinase)